MSIDTLLATVSHDTLPADPDWLAELLLLGCFWSMYDWTTARTSYECWSNGPAISDVMCGMGRGYPWEVGADG